MAKLNFPSSPTQGQTYTAPNGVVYTWDSTIGSGVWTGALPSTADPLFISNPGSLSGSAQVGGTMTYESGQASGGTAPYTYSWEWRLSSNNTVLQVNGATLTIPASALGDTIYIEFVATDSDLDTASANTFAYPSGSVIVRAPFPNLTFNPVGGPNASPASVNVDGLIGTATATWPGTPSPATLSVSGGIQISLNGGAYGTSGTISSGQQIAVIWDPSAISAAANNATITGSFTNGVYENTFSVTIDRSPSSFSGGFSDLTDQATSSQITSNSIIPAGYNVPITLTIAGTGTNPLTSIGASVNAGAYISGSQTVTPGQTIQLRGTTGAANSTAYGITGSLGAGPVVTDTWTVTTSAVVASIAQPSITAPVNGATNINPALNDPGAVTLTGSAYTAQNGAGTQTSSTWEVTSGSAGGTPIAGSPFTVSSAPFTSLDIPQSSFSTSTTYFARVQYATTNATAATSPYSAWSQFTTSSSFLPSIGDAYGGGYYAGQIRIGGNIYNLVIAPLASGPLEGQFGGESPGSLKWKNAGAFGPDSNAQGTSYGATAMLANSSASFQGFYWCVSNTAGPNAGTYDATNSTGTGIGGYNDWYIPAQYEFEILYRNLKPTGTANDTSVGANPFAVPSPTSNYTTFNPAQTTSNLFATGGSQAFTTSVPGYFSATESSADPTKAIGLGFTTGVQDLGSKGSVGKWRAIRRVLT